MASSVNDSRIRWSTLAGAIIGLALAGVPTSLAATTAEQLEFFETKVRPLLAEHCYACHSAKIESKRSSGR